MEEDSDGGLREKVNMVADRLEVPEIARSRRSNGRSGRLEVSKIAWLRLPNERSGRLEVSEIALSRLPNGRSGRLEVSEIALSRRPNCPKQYIKGLNYHTCCDKIELIHRMEIKTTNGKLFIPRNYARGFI